MRSARSIRAILAPPSNARSCTEAMSSRTSSTPSDFSGRSVFTSGWLSVKKRTQGPQTPQGLSAPVQSAVRARSRATERLPTPRGPTNR